MTRGDIASVYSNTEELLNLAEQYGLPQRAMGLAYRGWALASSGTAAEGLVLAKEGAGLVERSGTRIFLSRIYGVIAEIDLMGGRYTDGLTEVEKALHIASNIGELFYVSRLLQTRAMLMQAIGQPDEAVEATLRRSMALAAMQGLRPSSCVRLYA